MLLQQSGNLKTRYLCFWLCSSLWEGAAPEARSWGFGLMPKPQVKSGPERNRTAISWVQTRRVAVVTRGPYGGGGARTHTQELMRLPVCRLIVLRGGDGREAIPNCMNDVLEFSNRRKCEDPGGVPPGSSGRSNA